MYSKYEQYGGGPNPDKVWDKYKTQLLEKLHKDISFETEEVFNSLPVNFIECDISGTKYTYLDWIVRSYINNGIKRYEDLLSRTMPALLAFEKLKSKNILSKGTNSWEDENNIENYCGIVGCIKGGFNKNGLESILDKYAEQLSILNKETKESTISRSGVIFETSTIKIYHPENMEEAIYYGQGSKWCTAAKNNNMFDFYNKKGPLYVIIPKNPEYKGQKYQIHLSSKQYMNELDEEISLLELVNKYPDLIRSNIFTINDIISGGYDVNNMKIISKMLDFKPELDNDTINNILVLNVNIEIIDKLIALGIKFNISNLNSAIISGHNNFDLHETKMVINKILALGVKPDEYTLTLVLEYGNIEIINKILDFGERIDKNIGYAVNTLNDAIMIGNIEIINKVIDLGGRVGKYSLYYAIKTKKIKIVNKVIELKAPIIDDTIGHALYSNNDEIIISVFTYLVVLDKTRFSEIMKIIDQYLTNKKNKNKFKYIKYKVSCGPYDDIGLNELHDILNSINVKKINDKDISQLSKEEICDFLNREHKSLTF
jgi:hypothetical protein